MNSEFDLIARYFSRPTHNAILGVGDDAALVRPSEGAEIAVSSDTLVAGIHFLSDAQPRAVGHKALAVNLSDLAAMGARPRWVLLAITLPQIDANWLSEFADAFYRLAQNYGVDLIGGDTTRGPLAITVTVIGEVSSGMALQRDSARPGDDIWVSGQIGSAALALAHLRGDVRLKGGGLQECLAKLHTPEPRIDLGRELAGVANSAIDVSDGLVADAEHIAQRSDVRMEISYADVPCAPEVMSMKDQPLARQAILAGGDDYELLFSAPPDRSALIDAISARLRLALSRIGRVRAGSGVVVLDESGKAIELKVKGHDHFG
jgi:thiamine-monophosphate kinase